ncbi:glycosyltransferase family 2 protein [Parasulfitobacter algicola]|uniref:Glycosyltransferase n=1 Tax=Parasulfitobacter algicola TaxID=2614809 RepID=A0ABX2IRE2_9RHOB|nr:glycosyltransferase [Sulfitobacter algicola]NSX53362.1 glycosyltransferase [Sulfitobacter algicola]
MSDLRVSVVVVSRGRPDHLARCLTSLKQQIYPAFEVIVVTDIFGERVVETTCVDYNVKRLSFDEPNISAARNVGINAAAGHIVAFIDDDAVAEPTWLGYLVAPFDKANVAAVGGFVRGRNGISFQWKAQTADTKGQSHDIEVSDDQPTLLTPTVDTAIKTQGTNMAVRRNVLAKLGGFDTSYHFYLDDTDLNMRLARQGLKTAISPMAEVHHATAPSERRTQDRTPTSLYEIGASFAVYLSKYCETDDAEDAWVDFQAIQRKRLLQHMVAGWLEPSEVNYLMDGLIEGASEGVKRERRFIEPLSSAPDDFLPFQKTSPNGNFVIWGPIWDLKNLRAEAQKMLLEGRIVTVFALSHTPRRHSVKFDDGGFWMHRGGIFGRSVRNDRPGLHLSVKSRVIAETARVSAQRGLGVP